MVHAEEAVTDTEVLRPAEGLYEVKNVVMSGDELISLKSRYSFGPREYVPEDQPHSGGWPIKLFWR